MNLYRVTNGYYNHGPIATLVIAENEQSAIETARPIFEIERLHTDANSEFSERLEAEIVFIDTSIVQCTSIIECGEID